MVRLKVITHSKIRQLEQTIVSDICNRITQNSINDRT